MTTIQQNALLYAVGFINGGTVIYYLLILLAKRSGVAQPCPPSANGSSGARADDETGADSSVRSSEVNGSERACEHQWIPLKGGTAICNECGEIGIAKNAHQRSGERVLPTNAELKHGQKNR